MVSIPVKWARRISEQLKRYQLSVKRLKDQDANEADTVILVVNILSDLFGYDKRDNLTTECDPHENPCAPRQVASGIGTDWHVGVLSGWRSATALLQAHGLVQPHLGEV